MSGMMLHGLGDCTPEQNCGCMSGDARAETESLRSRALGDEQCCPDACDGGACETCPGCSAGWCVNGHDFAPGVWEQMSEEDHQQWFDVAREHNRGIDAALSERDRARARVAELEADNARLTEALREIQAAIGLPAVVCGQTSMPVRYEKARKAADAALSDGGTR